MRTTISLAITILFGVSLFVTPLVASGQAQVQIPAQQTGSAEPQLLSNVEGTRLGNAYREAISAGSIGALVNAFFRIALSVGAILAVFQFVRAGYVYMTSDLITSKTNAKQVLGDTLIGLMLLIGIWLILNQINPNLLNLDAFKEVPALQQSST